MTESQPAGGAAPVIHRLPIMKTRTHAVLLFSLSLALPSMADTFTLKDGKQLNARVIREDATSYVLEVQVTKTIKDERTVAKADVVKIERERPDLIAFEKLAKLKEVPDLTPASEYDQRIQTVETFLKEHKASSKYEEAKAVAEFLKKEANEILAGGIKLNGAIITADQYQSNRYELDARSQAVRIRRAIDAKQFLPALRSFGEFGKEFRNTEAYRELLPTILQVTKSYLGEVGQLSATYETRLKEREVGLQRMNQSDRSVAESAIREENTALEEQLKSEKEARVGWVTVHPFLKASLDDTLNFGKQELSRLSAPPSGTPVDAGKLYRDTLSMIQNKGGDASAVGIALNNAKNAQIPARYIERLESAAKSAGLAK